MPKRKQTSNHSIKSDNVTQITQSSVGIKSVLELIMKDNEAITTGKKCCHSFTCDNDGVRLYLTHILKTRSTYSFHLSVGECVTLNFLLLLQFCVMPSLFIQLPRNFSSNHYESCHRQLKQLDDTLFRHFYGIRCYAET